MAHALARAARSTGLFKKKREERADAPQTARYQPTANHIDPKKRCLGRVFCTGTLSLRDCTIAAGRTWPGLPCMKPVPPCMPVLPMTYPQSAKHNGL